MHRQPSRYYPGLELYRSPTMGLCGIENNADGNQGTYQFLTDEEALAWAAAWLRGQRWERKYDVYSELLESHG